MRIIDSATGLPVADPDLPLIDGAAADRPTGEWVQRVREAVDRMILSASGWRAVFAADRSEESRTTEVEAEFLIVAAIAARSFLEMLRERVHRTPTIALGMDTRPTGPAVARAALGSFLAAEAEVDYLFVTASPEIMAYAARSNDVDGFFYVSASHNPIGHNGLKMGGADGGVLGGDAAATLLRSFLERTEHAASITEALERLTLPAQPDERDCYDRIADCKAKALAEYEAFCRDVIRGPGVRSEQAYDVFLRAVRRARPGIVGDLNGSARAASIDRAFLEKTGCSLYLFNDTPGDVAHQIVPEGAGLAPCRERLDSLVQSGAYVDLGYVPDNDGDRGNLVVYDPAVAGARPLFAQEVFALSVVAELGWLVYTGALSYSPEGVPETPVAVVVNGPTSLRIERIAAAFGAEVHRAEVGEANVVGRARELRSEGYLVRILGEGSNGGNITHPSAVRDPLHTLHAVLKLVYAPATRRNPSPTQIWLARIATTDGERTIPVHDSPRLSEILSSLPRFTTTNAFEPEAKMQIRSTSHAALKAELETLLPEAFETVASRLPAELAIRSYEIVNYEGTRTLVGMGNRTGEERGGLKVVLLDDRHAARGFVWMRGSGTEPVFRVMADVEGDRPETERTLLEWIRDLVRRADGIASAG